MPLRFTSYRPFARPAIVLALLLLAPDAAAQISGTQVSGAAVIRYAEAGQPTLNVQVWGDVSRTGLFQVPRDTDLIRLLTLAGGPMVTGDRPQQRMDVNVSVIRQAAGTRGEVFSAHLDDISNGSTPLPELQDGDIVKVETSVRSVFNWRDAISIVSAAGTLTLLVLRVSDRL